MREYKTGTRWCFWRWKHVGYLTRLHFLQTPFGSICLHWLHRPDREHFLHDHPVTFLSLILKGSYIEHRYKEEKVLEIERRWFNFIKADPDVRHRIARVEPNTLTICFMGPNRRTWGFHTPEGWVSWKEYNG